MKLHRGMPQGNPTGPPVLGSYVSLVKDLCVSKTLARSDVEVAESVAPCATVFGESKTHGFQTPGLSLVEASFSSKWIVSVCAVRTKPLARRT